MTEISAGSDSRFARWWGRAVCVLIAVAAVVAVLLVSSPWGIGLTNDSVSYISAAGNVSEGHGLTVFDGEPMVHWPPLYPITLMWVGKAVGDYRFAALLIQAVAAGGLVGLCGLFVARQSRSGWLGVAGGTLAFASLGISPVFFMAWSEGLFSLFVMLTLISLCTFLRRPSMQWVLLCGLWAAMTCLSRYLGACLVITGWLLIILHKDLKIRQKLGYAAVFGIASLGPLVIWLVRNMALTGTLTGVRTPTNISPGENAILIGRAVVNWFGVPFRFDLAWPMVAGALVIGLFVLVWVTANRRSRDTGDTSNAGNAKNPQYREANIIVRVFLAALIVYVAALLISASLSEFDPISQRLLQPFYVPAVTMILILAGWFFKAYAKQPAASRSTVFLRYLVVAFVVGWCCVNLFRTARKLPEFHRDGTGGICTAAWRDSETIRYLRQHRLFGTTVSNNPFAIYMLAGQTALLSPRNTADKYSQRAILKTREKFDYLVWFNDISRDFLIGPDKLAASHGLKVVAKFPDGTIYQTKPRFPGRDDKFWQKLLEKQK
ncbi:MAG: glycosyltransferase family 39 protein [Phycisphaerae bacterium]|nr:glycosyltransferase family 39 protein [Phycisphaerae bacterium]